MQPAAVQQARTVLNGVLGRLGGTAAIDGPEPPSAGVAALKTGSRERRGQPRISLIALMLLLPIEGVSVLARREGESSGGYNDVMVFHLFDVALFFLVVLVLPPTIVRVVRRQVPLGLLTALLIVGFAAVSLPVHPSAHGLYVVVRLGAMAAVVSEISQLSHHQARNRVVIPLLVATTIQGVIAIVQVETGAPLGIGWGERSVLVPFGDAIGGSGTMLHPYVLGGLAILTVSLGVAFLPTGRWRMLWLAGVAVTSSIIGVTYGRALALGIVLVIGVLAVGAWHDRQRYAAATAVIVVSVLASALLFSEGWVQRGESSAEAINLNSASSGRLAQFEQALDLLEDAPILGLGPGQYIVTLRDKYPPARSFDVVHFVPLLIAVEGGALAGLVFVILMLGLAWRAFRVSPAALAVAMALSTSMAFDKFTYVHPNGLLIFAIWLGALDVLCGSDAAARQTAESVSDAQPGDPEHLRRMPPDRSGDSGGTDLADTSRP